MKVKAGELLAAYEVLKAAIRERRDDHVHLPTRAALHLALLVNRLEPDWLALSGIRVALLKSLGEEQRDRPGFWAVKPENQAKYDEEWQAACDEPVEVSARPLPAELLGEGASYFSLGELVVLRPFLKEAP